MKKKFYLSLILSALLLTGCQPKPDASSQQDITQSGGDSAAVSTPDPESSSLLASAYPTVSVADAVNDTEGWQDTVSAMPNFVLGENAVLNVLTDATQVSTFAYSFEPFMENAPYYEDFQEIFAYLFPGHPFAEDAVHFVGDRYYNDEDMEDPPKLIDYKEKILSGEEDVLYYYYDYYLSPQYSDRHHIYLDSQSPIGNGLFRFNKGVAAALYCEANDLEVGFLELYSPSRYATYITSYPPDSEEAYALIDETVRICDAVAFYEEYLNGLPFPEHPTGDLVVDSVDVWEIIPGVYCYGMSNTIAYQGIPYDQLPTHARGDVRGGIMSSGFMAVSDDVDYLYALPRSYVIKDEVVYDEIISVDTAIEIASEALSQSVTFRVDAIQLVYSPEQRVGSNPKPEEEYHPTLPMWKFTLYTENSGITYACYVNAVNGENFCYYTIVD